MSTSNTAIKTITVTAGECFILPVDAKITSVIVDGAVTFSSDGCPALPAELTTKTTQRVCAALLTQEANGSGTPNYESVYLQGMRINGVNYPFSSELVSTESLKTLWQSAIDSTSIGPLIKIEDVHIETDNRGDVAFVVMKCPESFIDQDFFFYARTSNAASGESPAEIFFKVYKYDDRIGSDNSNWPECA